MIRWLDVVDQTELESLLSASSLRLDNSTRAFLESFARLVHRASSKRRALLNAAIARTADLHTVNAVIADEVAHLQRAFPDAHVIPYRHPETSLPIVYLRLPDVPDLVVHVFRSYAATRRGTAFGFRAYSFCRSHLTGPLARAANYLRARCAANSWNLSVTQLVSLWCHQVAAIPPHQTEAPAPPRRKPRLMMRRRRHRATPSPPPVVPEPPHASLPHNHPKTDVVIKDDRLFPNRTFANPEELYAEQVRAIRNKCKPVPAGLDDYQLAWKKRRPAEHPQLAVDPVPQSHPEPHPHPPTASRPDALFPFHTPNDSSPSPEELHFTFVNPLSPEDHTEQPQIAQQHAAKMEAAERAVLAKPDTPSSQALGAGSNDDADGAGDNTPAEFYFSTAVDAHARPPADNAPSTAPATERVAVLAKHPVDDVDGYTTPAEFHFSTPVDAHVRPPADVNNAPPTAPATEGVAAVAAVGHAVTHAPKEEAGMEQVGQLGTEETDNATSTCAATQRSEPEVCTEQEKTISGLEEMPSSAEQPLSSSQRVDDPAQLKAHDTETPAAASPQILKASTAEEEQPTGTGGSRTPLESPPLSRRSVSPPVPVSDALEPTGDRRLAESHEPEGTAMKEKKRSRHSRDIQYSADVIIVDPDSDEEENRMKSAKKRRLSAATDRDCSNGEKERKDETTAPPLERDHADSPQERDASGFGGENEKKDETTTSHDERDQTGSPQERHVTGDLGDTTEGSEGHNSSVERQEKTREEPSPRNVSIWNLARRRALTAPESSDVRKEATEIKETEARHEVGAGGVKEVTPDVDQESRPRRDASASGVKEVARDAEQDEKRFSSFGAVSIPTGVDRDPCPMALSEPSDSSEESSDRDSNSDAGSVSDDAANGEER